MQSWVAAENAKTLAVLEQDPRYADNLAQAVATGECAGPVAAAGLLDDGVVGNFWQDARASSGGSGGRRPSSITSHRSRSGRRCWISDALAQAEGRNWVWEGMGCDPVTRMRCLVKLSEGGEDAVTVREFDRATGQFVPGGFVLERGKQYTSWVDGEHTAGVAGMAAGGDDGLGVSLHRQALAAWAAAGGGGRGRARRSGRWACYRAGALLDNGAGRRLSLVARRPSFYEVQFTLLDGGQPVRLALPPKADVEAMVGNQVLVSLRQDWTAGGTNFH